MSHRVSPDSANKSPLATEDITTQTPNKGDALAQQTIGVDRSTKSGLPEQLSVDVEASALSTASRATELVVSFSIASRISHIFLTSCS